MNAPHPTLAPGNTDSRQLAARLGARLDGTIGDRFDPDASEIWRHAHRRPA
ncbi:MAG: hypothetical protein HLUCCA12_13635 [Rhodobacteraceae bacterium HLUCCA12]|nr:MAG: hypothetical protein HLUCCA12_13635 [Rhodobacteraceae bacterium HLUCCA12]